MHNLLLFTARPQVDLYLVSRGFTGVGDGDLDCIFAVLIGKEIDVHIAVKLYTNQSNLSSLQYFVKF